MRFFALLIAASASLMGIAHAAAEVRCTVGNWSNAVGLTDANVGVPSASNRRYTGPCGLRVPIVSTPAYVENTDDAEGNALGESIYYARFYFFINHVNTEVTVFRALDGSDSVVELEVLAADNTLRLKLDGNPVGEAAALRADRWNSAEIRWDVDANLPLATLVVNGDVISESPVPTPSARIRAVQLGAIATGAQPSGSIDFDGFDSRRTSSPGRLPVGVAADGSSDEAADLMAVRTEILGQGFAPGQPDCDEDGQVGASDIVCIRDLSLDNNN